jgi:TPR repeat protein
MKNLLASILIFFPLFAFATFEDGVDAFNRGDYAKAAKQWQPLASKGDSDAARNLASRVRHQMTQVVDSYRACFKLATTRGSTGRLGSVF